VLEGHVPELSKIRSDVPRALDDVLKKTIQRDASLRFGTALELAAAIEHACPVAPQRDVATWVSSLAGDLIEERKKLIAIIEQTPVDAADVPPLEQRKRLVEAATDIVVTSEPESQITSLSSTTSVSPRVRALPWAALVLVAAAISVPLFLRSRKSSSVAPATPSTSTSEVVTAPSAPSAPPPPAQVAPTQSAVPTAVVTHAPRRPSHPACDPPFIIDAAGVKRFKPQCL
jgi:serine/threonine-protein kinase